MRHVLIIAGLIVSSISAAEAAQMGEFALACVFHGGRHSFVVQGDYTEKRATISHSSGMRTAYVASNFKLPPTLSILVRGKTQRDEDWRDLYIVDTALGTFTHVHETWADGPNSDPFMAVQSGTCTSARPQ